MDASPGHDSKSINKGASKSIRAHDEDAKVPVDINAFAALMKLSSIDWNTSHVAGDALSQKDVNVNTKQPGRII